MPDQCSFNPLVQSRDPQKTLEKTDLQAVFVKTDTVLSTILNAVHCVISKSSQFGKVTQELAGNEETEA